MNEMYLRVHCNDTWEKQRNEMSFIGCLIDASRIRPSWAVCACGCPGLKAEIPVFLCFGAGGALLLDDVMRKDKIGLLKVLWRYAGIGSIPA
ncbi:MAG: hypothetical protein IKD69_02475 [Solobacterium sp.]|nr:hypothetical protein [Solobacterium sp.]